jgi:hypothetical protein
MRRTTKVKALATSVPLRKTATSSSTAARRNFPAWIDATEGIVAFPARTVTPRVRDGLVLRTVSRKKPAKPEGSANVHGGR